MVTTYSKQIAIRLSTKKWLLLTPRRVMVYSVQTIHAYLSGKEVSIWWTKK
jgi:hypothetical protein